MFYCLWIDLDLLASSIEHHDRPFPQRKGWRNSSDSRKIRILSKKSSILGTKKEERRTGKNTRWYIVCDVIEELTNTHRTKKREERSKKIYQNTEWNYLSFDCIEKKMQIITCSMQECQVKLEQTSRLVQTMWKIPSWMNRIDFLC